MKILLAAREQDSTDNYRAALTACGVEFDVKLHDVDVDEYAGLLLPGGGDIDPARYGEGLNGSGKIDAELDAGQFEVLDKFVKKNKPVFGICRGCQLINVYFGGSLYQDIETAEQHKSHITEKKDDFSSAYENKGDLSAEKKVLVENLIGEINEEEYPDKAKNKETHIRENITGTINGSRVDNIHKVLSEENSLIKNVYGKEFVVNSAHHQAVKKQGIGLRITLVAEDGVCEAIEHEFLPVFAVQWHPERTGFDYKRSGVADGEKIFRLFMDFCSRIIKN